MRRTRPPALVVMGCCCLGFAVLYFGWLLAYHGGDLLDMVRAALGNSEALDYLLQQNLARSRAVFLTLLTVCINAALMAVLFLCGLSLLTVRGWGRWSALFFAAVVLPVAVGHTLLYLSWFTLAGQPIRIGPLIMDAVIIQFAITLGGTMFLPSVTAVYRPNADTSVTGNSHHS